MDVDGDADCLDVHDDGDAASSGGEEWQAVVDASLARAAAVSKDDDDGVVSGRRAAAAEFGGWVFASGKRIGRISTTVGNPSSSAGAMYFVACYKHGGSCGKLVHLNARLDRASCLRWVCSWRFYGDAASHTNALMPNETFVEAGWAPLVPDDAPAPSLPRTLASSVGPRFARAIPFGPWSISLVCPDGIFSAWGANCNDHQNYNCLSKRCKTSLAWGSRMSPDEARRRVKYWLLQGLQIDRPFGLPGRKHRLAVDDHMNCVCGVDFRTAPISDIPLEAELDQRAEEEEDRRLAAQLPEQGVRGRPRRL